MLAGDEQYLAVIREEEKPEQRKRIRSLGGGGTELN